MFCINRPKYTLEKEISVAKRNYSEKLRIQFIYRDSASVRKGLKEFANYKTPSPNTVENQQLADDLNEFYCRFEKTPHTRSEHLSTQPLTPPATPQKRKKAPGPDGVTPACLKSCADPHLHTDLQQNIITGLNDCRRLWS